MKYGALIRLGIESYLQLMISSLLTIQQADINSLYAIASYVLAAFILFIEIVVVFLVAMGAVALFLATLVGQLFQSANTRFSGQFLHPGLCLGKFLDIGLPPTLWKD